MINKRKKTNKKISVFFLIIIILLSIMYICFNNRNINKIKIYFNNIGNRIINYFVIDNNINEEISLGINKELEEENNKLKKLLEIKENNYNMITALVLKRDVDWYNSFTINKGKIDGIKKNMAVIDSYGLIGKIVSVLNNSSVVSLITSSNNKVAVSILSDDNEYYGIIDSYIDDFIIVKNISKNNNIKIGDKVYTNGLGGIYPSGIYVGNVKSISSDDLDLSKIVKVKRENTFDNIRYVNVIRR